MTFQVNLLAAIEESIFCQDSPSRVADKEDESEKIARHEEVSNFSSQIWTLYFDGSKNRKRGWEKDVSSLTQKGNKTSYPAD
jgi:hypothetical protein